MKSLNIVSNNIDLAINDDPKRVISFNPNDINFMERFIALMNEFPKKEAEFREKASEIEKFIDSENAGISENAAQTIELYKEMCKYFHFQIDQIFGNGSSQKAFGDAYDIDLIVQFFKGIAPIVEDVRNRSKNKYRVQDKAKAVLK